MRHFDQIVCARAAALAAFLRSVAMYGAAETGADVHTILSTPPEALDEWIRDHSRELHLSPHWS
jgi:hypothetical protein